VTVDVPVDDGISFVELDFGARTRARAL